MYDHRSIPRCSAAHAHPSRAIRRSLLACALLALAPALAAGSWAFIDLHPPSSTFASVGNHIDGGINGQQAGWSSFGTWRGGIWSGTAASFVDLTPTGAGMVASFVWGTHNGQQSGSVSSDNLNFRAAAWSGTAASYVDLHPGGYNQSRSLAIHSGQQVGWADAGAGQRAAAWNGSAASFVNLHPAGAIESTAWAAHGGQQGGVVLDNTFSQRAALWSGSAASYVDLTPGGANAGWVRGMAAGQQVGDAYIGGIQHAALWTGAAASFVDLHPAGAANSYAWGVHGSYQVGTANIGGIDRAYLWSGSAASAFDLHALIPLSAGALGSGARAVWDDGLGNITVVGQIQVTGIGSRAVMWHFTIPAPGTVSLAVIAGYPLATRRRR